MPVNLSVKNVPDDLAERLRRRAATNRRSLQRELMSILESAAGYGAAPRTAKTSEAPRGTMTIEEVAELSRKLFPRGTQSSVAYIRRMRGRR
jgi:plasmid stability protein